MNQKLLQVLFACSVIGSWLFIAESIKHDVWNMVWSIKSSYDYILPSLIIMGMMFWFVVGSVSLLTVFYDPMKVVSNGSGS